jgi:hypothetical protein
VAPVSTINDDIMGRTTEVQSVVGTISLGSIVREAGEWAQSISALVYEAEGDYFMDRLNRMWVQEQAPPSVEVIGSDRWGTFQGELFQKDRSSGFAAMPEICITSSERCIICRSQ